MSRNWVVLNFGRLVYIRGEKTESARVMLAQKTYREERVGLAYVDIEAEDRVFLPRALQAGDLGGELVVRHVLLLLG